MTYAELKGISVARNSSSTGHNCRQERQLCVTKFISGAPITNWYSRYYYTDLFDQRAPTAHTWMPSIENGDAKGALHAGREGRHSDAANGRQRAA